MNTNTYNINIEYTPTNKANSFKYYIPILTWRYGTVAISHRYDDTYDKVFADITITDGTIGVVRSVTFLINRTTGTVKISNMGQANLQSDGNFIFSKDTMDGVGLLGIKW